MEKFNTRDPEQWIYSKEYIDKEFTSIDLYKENLKADDGKNLVDVIYIARDKTNNYYITNDLSSGNYMAAVPNGFSSISNTITNSPLKGPGTFEKIKENSLPILLEYIQGMEKTNTYKIRTSKEEEKSVLTDSMFENRDNYKELDFVSVTHYQANLGKSDDGKATIRDVVYIARDSKNNMYEASDKSADKSLSLLVSNYTTADVLQGPGEFTPIRENVVKDIERYLKTMQVVTKYQVNPELSKPGIIGKVSSFLNKKDKSKTKDSKDNGFSM